MSSPYSKKLLFSSKNIPSGSKIFAGLERAADAHNAVKVVVVIFREGYFGIFKFHILSIMQIKCRRWIALPDKFSVALFRQLRIDIYAGSVFKLNIVEIYVLHIPFAAALNDRAGVGGAAQMIEADTPDDFGFFRAYTPRRGGDIEKARTIHIYIIEHNIFDLHAGTGRAVLRNQTDRRAGIADDDVA